MKILAKHKNLRSFPYQLMLIGMVFLSLFSYLIAYCFRAQIIWFALAILFMLTPWANRKMSLKGLNVKSFSWMTCIGLTFLMQLGLMLAFYTICNVTDFGFPNENVPLYLFQLSLIILFTHWGIFPWGVYALLAVAISYVLYIKEKPGQMSTLIEPFIKNVPMDTISISIDVFTRIAILFSLASTLALIAMQFVLLLTLLFHHPIVYGIRLDIITLLLVIFKVMQDNRQKSFLNGFLKRRWPPFVIILSFLTLITLALWLSALFIGWFSPKYTPILSSHITQLPSNGAAIWPIFMAMWWLGWAPLAAGMLAYIWKGYRMRTMVFFTLLLPVILTILLTLHPDWLMVMDLKKSLWNFLPAIISLMIIMGLFLRAQPITYASRAILPSPIKTYKRSANTFLKVLAQTIVFIMGMYWMGSTYGIGIIYFSLLYPMGLSLLVAGIAVFKSFIQNN